MTPSEKTDTFRTFQFWQNIWNSFDNSVWLMFNTNILLLHQTLGVEQPCILSLMKPKREERWSSRLRHESKMSTQSSFKRVNIVIEFSYLLLETSRTGSVVSERSRQSTRLSICSTLMWLRSVWLVSVGVLSLTWTRFEVLWLEELIDPDQLFPPYLIVWTQRILLQLLIEQTK